MWLILYFHEPINFKSFSLDKPIYEMEFTSKNAEKVEIKVGLINPINKRHINEGVFLFANWLVEFWGQRVRSGAYHNVQDSTNIKKRALQVTHYTIVLLGPFERKKEKIKLRLVAHHLLLHFLCKYLEVWVLKRMCIIRVYRFLTRWDSDSLCRKMVGLSCQ